jgi:hypothetical protein
MLLADMPILASVSTHLRGALSTENRGQIQSRPAAFHYSSIRESLRGGQRGRPQGSDGPGGTRQRGATIIYRHAVLMRPSPRRWMHTLRRSRPTARMGQ